MLQNKFERPLDLAIRVSKLFYVYFFIVFLLAFISIISASPGLFVQFMLFIMFLTYGIIVLRLSSTPRVSKLVLKEDSSFEIISKNKERFEVELSGECIVTSFLIWLNFSLCNNENSNKKFHILLLPDSADKEQLRQLRVRLRLSGKKPALTEPEE